MRSLFGIVLLLLLAACASRRVEEAAPEEPAPAAKGDDVLDRAAQERQLRQQFGHVMCERLHALALRQRDAGQFALALETVTHALDYEPTSEMALRLRDELLRIQGDRAGESRTILDDHWEAYKARQQEREIAVRVWIRRAEEAAEAGDYEAAKRAYERALYIVEMSK